MNKSGGIVVEQFLRTNLLHVRPEKHGHTECCRFERIMTAVIAQAAADKGGIGTCKGPDKLTHRIEYQYMFPRTGNLLCRASYAVLHSSVGEYFPEHRDGEIVTNTLDSAGFGTVRGSTTRGGVRALVRLVKLARQGARLGFTSDGPRGPRWKFQPGAVFIAAKTGMPLVPITGSAKHAHYFKSWDRFQLPMPFSRAVLNVGEPYYVTGGSDPENIEYHRLEIERRLTELTVEADEIVGASSGQ